MNNEKLKQIQEAIINTVSCIDAHNGDHVTNTVLNDHLKTLTDMEAGLLRGYIHDQSIIHEPNVPKQHCNVATEFTIERDPHPFDGKRAGSGRLIVKLENGTEVIYKVKDKARERHRNDL